MKKVFALFAILFCAFIFSACGQNNLSTKENMSDVRDTLYDAKSNSVYASFISGLREDPYIYDGKAGKLVEFGIITVHFNNKVKFKEISYKLTDGEKTIEGILEKNPFTDEYMADIGTKTFSASLSLEMSADDFSDSLTMVNKSSSWGINKDNAIELAEGYLKNEIKKYSEGGQFKAECQIKMINDMHTSPEIYFWFFSLIAQDGTSYNCIMDTETGEMLAKT